MLLKRKRPTNQVDSCGRMNGTPVIRSSICTGEKTAGFISGEDGHFTEVMLIRTPEDLRQFCKMYGLREEQIRTVY